MTTKYTKTSVAQPKSATATSYSAKFRLAIALIIVLGAIMTTMTTQNTQAQVPPAIIDCDGSITCQNPEPWEEINNMSFMYGSCIINPRFKVTKCCDALGNCEYIVEILEILVGGNNCAPNYDLYKEEAIKFIMAKSPEIFNIGNFKSFNLHLKQPKCMKNEHGNFFTFQYIRMYACDPTSCCLAVYRLNTYYEKINVQNQYPYQYDDFVYCENLAVPNCEYACFPLDFTPDLDIMFADYGGGQDPCLADCFWRLDGNDNVTTNNFIGPTNGTDFSIRTGMYPQNIERLRVTADGNIGIGITSPTAKFEMKGNGSDGLTSILKLFNSNTFPVFSILDNGDINLGGSIRNINGIDPIKMEKLFIGVGTPDPLYKLTVVGSTKINGVLNISNNLKVHGTIYTTEVLINDPISWPDYVFEKDYKLASLYEVSDFIKMNGHLPDVPSKEDIEKDGLKLVEMHTILLKKIEELTLHLIELKRDNDLLTKEVDKLRLTK